MKQPRRHGGEDHRDQHSRPVRREPPQQEDQRRRAKPDGERRRRNRRQGLRKHRKFRQQLPGLGAGQLQAAEILELAGEDRDRDAAGEADGHRMGNVADQHAEPQKADQRQHETVSC